MRLLLADDHDLVREAIASYLRAADLPAQVDTAATLDQALEKAAAVPYDLVLLDLYMPGMNGLQGLERMRAALPEARLAILSGTDDRDVILAITAGGMASFIPKTMPVERLANVLRLIASGETYVPVHLLQGAAEARRQPSAAAPARLDRPVSNGGPHLTRREQEVLDHLLLGSSNKEIARALGIKEVTIKLHLRGLYRKLDARNRTQAVLQALDRSLPAAS